MCADKHEVLNYNGCKSALSLFQYSNYGCVEARSTALYKEDLGNIEHHTWREFSAKCSSICATKLAEEYRDLAGSYMVSIIEREAKNNEQIRYCVVFLSTVLS